MTDVSHVIPPDGTCAVGSCYAPTAHCGTHFCVMHQARGGSMSAEVATINGRLPGDGTCVATDCGASIRDGALMCRAHWKRLPRGLRHRMRHEWAMWGHGLSTLGDLRAVQRECVHALDRLDEEDGP